MESRTPFTELRVEPLGKHHDRAAFSCGVEALDNYFKRHAGQDVAKHAAVCFVLTPDGITVSGYYTLSQYAVDLAGLPEEIAKKLPKYPEVPTTLLGRLAVGQKFKGRKLGEFLLMDALFRSLQQSRSVASAGVVVDTKDLQARGFYEHFGFISLPGRPDRMFLPMQTIEKMFA